MSTAKQDAGLVIAMSALARAHPQAWSGFMAELLLRAEKEKEGCIMSPPDRVQLMQGRAQATNEIAKLAANCVREHEQMLSTNTTKGHI